MKTLLYTVRELGDEPHLMNEIQSHSRFKTLPWWAKSDGNDPEVQLRAAREIIQGWKDNGPHPRAEYFIEQYDAGGFLFNETV